MKREDLIKLGIAEDVVDKIMAINGQDIEGHKTKLTTAQTEIDGLKKQLTEASTAIEGFKKLDVDSIKAAADDYKAKFEAATVEGAKQLSALKFDHALDGALAGAKVKYSKEVLARLKLDELKDKDGNFIPERFDSQVKTVKESAADLFSDDTPTPKIVAGGNNQSVIGDPFMAAMRKGAGLPEQK